MDFLDTSHWVPIHTLPGFQSAIEYYISRDGEVLSTKGNKERILKTSLTADGYEMVRLRKRLGDRGEIGVVVHKLVAFAFLPPPPTPNPSQSPSPSPSPFPTPIPSVYAP